MSNFRIARELNKVAKQLVGGSEDDYREVYNLDEFESLIEKKFGEGLKFYYVKKGDYLEMNTNDFSKKTGPANHFIKQINLYCAINLKARVPEVKLDTQVRFAYSYNGGSNDHLFIRMEFDGINWVVR